MHTLSFALLTSLAATAVAQIPNPNPQPQTAPRAEWVVTTNVMGSTPANRHWSQAASNGASMFVFAGRTGTSGSGSRRNDLWEFDGVTKTWTEHNADGAPGAPPQRFRNAAAWDETNGVLVIFGGEDPSGGLLGDTWQWDPATNVWTDVTPTTGGSPSPRRFSAMAHDPATGGLLLFGGDAGSGALSDTWIWFGGAGGGSWAPITSPTTPPERANHSIVTRPETGDVLMCAGITLDAAPNRIHHVDVWRWDGADWSLIATPPGSAVPASMAGNQAVYDPLRRRLVMQGGQGISTNSAATGGAYGTLYGGSPSGWCSEFDSVSNEWTVYGGATASTANPVLGRASRYYAAFLVDRIYMFGGQNPSGIGTSLLNVKEYQAQPIASSTSFGAGCTNGAGALVALSPAAGEAPWTGRSFNATASGLAPGALAVTFVGFTATNLPLSAVFPAPAGCELLVQQVVALPLAATAGSAAVTLPIDAGATALIGIPVLMQALQVEPGPGGIAAVSASNGLSLDLGAL